MDAEVRIMGCSLSESIVDCMQQSEVNLLSDKPLGDDPVAKDIDYGLYWLTRFLLSRQMVPVTR